MRRGLLSALLLALVTLPVPAQDVEGIKADSGSWLWAEGYGKNVEEADKDAMSALVRMISVCVKDNFKHYEKESYADGELTSSSTIESKVQTFATATLNNCQRVILKNEFEDCIVFRYISKSELDNVFKYRQQKIREFLDIALRSESELKIDDALKYLYWSQMLLHSLPSGMDVEYDEGGSSVHCSVFIPRKISSILDALDFRFDSYSSEDRTLGLLAITYGGKSVASVDFTYYDGIGGSEMIQAKNGKGPVEFRSGVETSKISVVVEYAYTREAGLDRDLKHLVGSCEIPSYREAFKNDIAITASSSISASSSASGSNTPSASLPTVSQAHLQLSTMAPGADMASLTKGDNSAIGASVLSVVESLKAGTTADSGLFTDEGFTVYDNLLKYGRAKVLELPQFKYYTLGDHTFCRSVPMMFSFPGYRSKFVENVVFEFDGSGKICNISFALEDVSVDDITNKSRWSAEAKLVLINFLENYKTAFALGRLDYLKSVFSEDALIITGRVLRKTYLENQIRGTDYVVIYNKQTKSQYIKHLEKCFHDKDFINIKFTNARFLKMDRGTNPNVFSIQLRQDYCSSNYSDSGYLFLLVDIQDSSKPVIHVRTWQPKPDERYGVFGPEDDIYS